MAVTEQTPAAKPPPAPSEASQASVFPEQRTVFAGIIRRIDPATAAREAASAIRRDLPAYAALD